MTILRGSLLIVAALAALTACGRNRGADLEAREVGGIDSSVQAEEVLTSDGVEYQLRYQSHGLWQDAAQGAGEGQGAPVISVTLTDGRSLTVEDIPATRAVARAWCADHPEFRRDEIFGDGVVESDGTIFFSEVCD